MKNDENPLVSICLLTYKRAASLRQSLDSILAQTYHNWELVINDDCSPDETEQICREYEKRDPRVRYCRNEANLRYAGNQSAAVQRAKGEYVAILHDGDVYAPTLVEKWLRALQRNPTAALVFNGYSYQDNPRKTILPINECCSGRQMLDFVFSLGYSPIWGIVMVRKSKVLEVGPFDVRLPTLADVDMWLRLMQRFDVAYVPEVLLTIAGREVGHSNQTWNWKIHAQEDIIFWLNSARAYPAGDLMHYPMKSHVSLLLWRRNLLCLAWCILHLKPKPLLAGLRHCLTHNKRRRNLESSGLGVSGIWPKV